MSELEWGILALIAILAIWQFYPRGDGFDRYEFKSVVGGRANVSCGPDEGRDECLARVRDECSARAGGCNGFGFTNPKAPGAYFGTIALEPQTAAGLAPHGHWDAYLPSN